ncbi:hypothetical protein HMPREF9420_2568 [Segatella salivae DSM 15606]|uniref:Uncharacterized protein n=1 Tax=Segatella salivae DSM 15606 TaxID=888832 RepID=E6MSV0_9BACT|nr:hypothetical protein HMPREF9420_2568 [Segatella salivae DSM 15606]
MPTTLNCNCFAISGILHDKQRHFTPQFASFYRMICIKSCNDLTLVRYGYLCQDHIKCSNMRCVSPPTTPVMATHETSTK